MHFGTWQHEPRLSNLTAQSTTSGWVHELEMIQSIHPRRLHDRNNVKMDFIYPVGSTDNPRMAGRGAGVCVVHTHRSLHGRTVSRLFIQEWQLACSVVHSLHLPSSLPTLDYGPGER